MKLYWIFLMFVDEFKRTWACYLFGHDLPYKVIKAGGKSFLEVLPCRNCGHTVDIKW